MFFTTSREITMMFRREVELAAPVARFLRNRAFTLQKLEVPFYEYQMDMYGYSRARNLTVAVELKLTRWRRAVEQALLYQLCSDLVFIAMPRLEVRRVDLGLLADLGIGLIGVGMQRSREILPAEPSGVLREHYRNEFLVFLNEGV